MDVKKQLNNALETGEVLLGSNKTIKALLYGEPKMVLLSQNCPKDQRESITYYCMLSDTPCITLTDDGIELGSGIGRSHILSTVCILDEGDSTILEVKT